MRRRIPLQRIRELSQVFSPTTRSIVPGPLDLEDLAEVLIEMEETREAEEQIAQGLEAAGAR